MLKRSEVAKRLGKSVATVRRMEGRELHPRVDNRGVHLFDPDEVENVAMRFAHTRPRSRAADSDWRDWLRKTVTERERDSEERERQRERERRDEVTRIVRRELERAEREAAEEERERFADLQLEALTFLSELTPRELRKLARDAEFQELLAELELA